MRDNKTYQNFKVTRAPSVTPPRLRELRVPPSSRRKAFLLTPLYRKSAEKTSSLPKFCACQFSVKDNREKRVSGHQGLAHFAVGEINGNAVVIASKVLAVLDGHAKKGIAPQGGTRAIKGSPISSARAHLK